MTIQRNLPLQSFSQNQWNIKHKISSIGKWSFYNCINNFELVGTLKTPIFILQDNINEAIPC